MTSSSESSKSLPVRITSLAGNQSTGTMNVRHWSKKDLTRRAGKFWAACWAGALFSVILPLVHFVLVPALLIAGPVGAWIISTQGSSLLGGEATCPDCGAKLPLSPGPDRWPLRDLCSACQHEVRVEHLDPAHQTR